MSTIIQAVVNDSISEFSGYFDSKAIACQVLSGVLLILFGPLMLLCMGLVLLTSRGPAMYSQVRVGKHGKLFKVHKIRTMYVDAEKLSGPQLCAKRDARVTPVGGWLRFLHLDELPQLFNVLHGEMCLIGPRPERPEIIEKNYLREIVPGFDNRTSVLPGVTGLAQINLPADQSAKCVIPKVALDLEYIRTASLGLDLRILLCTACRMLGVRHGIAVKLLRLDRHIDWNSVDEVWDNQPAHLTRAMARKEPQDCCAESKHSTARKKTACLVHSDAVMTTQLVGECECHSIDEDHTLPHKPR
ncbi:sugar transferase [Aeoliella mucimassa]|uniref:Undecaprenyl-phosphate N-acetylgalactosaminyl 1-phosphate transferase n=1 Tax=Aeoliella mucimassa TaxID=2527972 RepID=A0A518ALS8_9BACT|nr:sugar transferase [Aeoliella mucimassa]QDU55671.1 Putative undecaprenyl-phosphate N-acetylgalactosaminyl 1-phosphate transferase [Aeoliella mucimassa]